MNNQLTYLRYPNINGATDSERIMQIIDAMNKMTEELNNIIAELNKNTSYERRDA